MDIEASSESPQFEITITRESGDLMDSDEEIKSRPIYAEDYRNNEVYFVKIPSELMYRPALVM